MKNKIVISAFLGVLGLAVLTPAYAVDNNIYNAQKFQQVCKGKSAGSTVSFSYQGVTWNGSCQTQFFPSKKNVKINNQTALIEACASDRAIKSIDIDGQAEAGRCALGFSPPAPQNTMPQ